MITFHSSLHSWQHVLDWPFSFVRFLTRLLRELRFRAARCKKAGKVAATGGEEPQLEFTDDEWMYLGRS